MRSPWLCKRGAARRAGTCPKAASWARPSLRPLLQVARVLQSGLVPVLLLPLLEEVTLLICQEPPDPDLPMHTYFTQPCMLAAALLYFARRGPPPGQDGSSEPACAWGFDGIRLYRVRCCTCLLHVLRVGLAGVEVGSHELAGWSSPRLGACTPRPAPRAPARPCFAAQATLAAALGILHKCFGSVGVHWREPQRRAVALYGLQAIALLGVTDTETWKALLGKQHARLCLSAPSVVRGGGQLAGSACRALVPLLRCRCRQVWR